ncbi:MAG: hypothetical protein C0429_09630 [Sphingopyxis sp.]|nr:hypothetical protein [Sphingopyxis sp.]
MNNKLEKSRALNMEEKRKLEKLLIEDIDSAKRLFAENASNQRSALIKGLEAKIPAEVQALFSSYQNSKKAMDEAEEKLEAIGWNVPSYGDKRLAVKTYGNMPKELVEFDEKVDGKKAEIASLTRTFTLKLFAPGVEAQTLFDDLANKVTKLVS